MPYRTECPKCHIGNLRLMQFTGYCALPIHADGFDFTDSAIETDDELVSCDNCDYEGELEWNDTPFPDPFDDDEQEKQEDVSTHG